jgi:precorrin-6B methylase 2
MVLEPTPLRSLGARQPDGTVLLRDVQLPYRDGGEDEVLRIISGATDLGSLSDELVCHASGWAQTYHLHPARANVLRCLALPATARVLEVGAGCGAITRYLGEVCGSVDALEPVPVRAAAARARTHDLDTVEVFVGELDDVPAEAVYDVIVVIGVLEYVAGGGADVDTYLTFLRAVSDRLVAGGSLVLAIENQLGVKYLVGAPEDHSNRVFDSIEGYPVGAPARTFSRRQLTDLLTAAGLRPTFRAAFPDYKMTRGVFGDLPAGTRSLLYRIPRFPSPDWVAARPLLADEGLLWRSLVEAGLEQDTGNSFLVLAGKNAPSGLWPAAVAASFYSMGRRARYTAGTQVRVVEDGVEFHRSPLRPEVAGPDDRYRIAASAEVYRPGQDLVEHLATHPDADLADLLARWLRLVEEYRVIGGLGGTLDVVPHNLVISEDGRLHVIDVELFGTADRDQVVRRGLYWLAYHVCRASPPGRWGAADTVGEVAAVLGAAAGLVGTEWLDRAVREEAAVQTEIQNGPLLGMSESEWAAKFEAELHSALGQRLIDLPLGSRLTDHHTALAAQFAAERRDHDATRAQLGGEIDQLTARIAALDAQILRSPLARTRRTARRALARLLPFGTRRRKVASRLTRGRC